jgi:hypothetical protein
MATVAPIATVEQFKEALLAVRDKNLPDTHLTMLRAQCRSPNSTITATQLAQAAEYQNYNAANLQYGTLAFNIAGHLGFSPAKRPDGTPRWWTTLSYSDGAAGDSDAERFQFIMRPELVQALREMKWA